MNFHNRPILYHIFLGFSRENQAVILNKIVSAGDGYLYIWLKNRKNSR